MVTFNCEVCNDTVPKKNTEKHYSRCPDAYYTCIDCSKTFDDGVSYKNHTQCLTEDEKYQGALYKGKGKGKKEQPKKQEQPKKEQPKKQEEPKKQPEPAKTADKEPKKSSKVSKPKSTLRSELKSGKSLYEIFDSVDKKLKKQLLKNLIVDEKGRVILKE
ncbi:hypothetical protein ZYGR_0N07430 [Zygosaccharomyces rouxii]|uniref:ZYRO0D17336p n=2 Tax=Zygosaccharomyces rouxii TaxID=4956 RepID=C5DWT1_ZYGRC|nr:uncharacterized protein ZYRO0D17336g [Zygosaccharomyces rouxii]KAH9201160.1 hypothetical protein LQ764DRAFT_103999 [Zygosaccharomyces rouxii]GAV49336.1 hypothetical protein ZYGR_0N07430 [Zygosaccharomyces rouxii]CAQ43510.1 Uncharacterized protein YCR087C-A [Zygosaccharomyces rouxii]CAR28250.1 ZYRO0D17336p [Zygosaccharomyces rouxii]